VISVGRRLLARILSDPDGSIRLIRRLFSEVFHVHFRTYLAAVACMIGAAAATAATALVMRHVINDVFIAHELSMMWALSLAVVALSLVKGIAAYGQAVTLGRIGSRIIATIQRRVFDKILTLGVEYFSRRHSSELVSRISHNARAARDVVTVVSTSLGRDLLTVIALTGVMIYLNPLMALLTASIGPAIIFGMAGLSKRIRQLSADEFKSIAGITAAAQETIHGIRIVKSFTLEAPMREKVSAAVAKAEWRANALTRIQATRVPIVEGLGGVAVGIVIVYAGWNTIAEGQTPGEFMAFITAFLLAYEPTKRLTAANLQLQRSLGGVRMLYQLLDLPDREPEIPGAVELGRARGGIVLDGVTFGYLPDKPVLHDVSLEADAGSVVALVGPSGAGKTTIVSLIQRFYDPWSGTISIDGMDMRNVTLESLRRQISFVSQDTFLFSGTVRENILVGSSSATEEDIIAALEAANASDFVANLPEQLDTAIGENGATLSGGQRQRIAIARAVLKDAPVLILDEATSALDTESERQVQAALERLMRGRMTIVIAHRLSTITRADRTYVIEAGKVVESGSHHSLIARNRLYARLFGPSSHAPLDVGADLAKQWEIARL
jgi:ATP-binding cassette, subfamily B, bacterial MsbA